MSGVTVLGDGINIGMGAALNMGCNWARSRGYLWAATLDQDSRLPPVLWHTMLSDSLLQFTFDDIAIISCCYRYVGASSLIKGFANRFWIADPRNSAACIRVWLTMTSGNLVNLAALDELGGFDDTL